MYMHRPHFGRLAHPCGVVAVATATRALSRARARKMRPRELASI